MADGKFEYCTKYLDLAVMPNKLYLLSRINNPLNGVSAVSILWKQRTELDETHLAIL
jgi:hypothetical protein